MAGQGADFSPGIALCRDLRHDVRAPHDEPRCAQQVEVSGDDVHEPGDYNEDDLVPHRGRRARGPGLRR